MLNYHSKKNKIERGMKVYRKLVKNMDGWKIIQFNEDGTKTIIAKIEKHEKKGYNKYIYSNTLKQWILPKCFSWYPTLKAIKEITDCI